MYSSSNLGFSAALLILVLLLWLAGPNVYRRLGGTPESTHAGRQITRRDAMGKTIESLVEKHVESSETHDSCDFMCIDGRGQAAGYGVLGSTAGIVARCIGAYLHSVPEHDRELAEERLLGHVNEFLTWFDREATYVQGHTAAQLHDPTKPGCGYLAMLLGKPELWQVSSPVTTAILEHIEDRLLVLPGEHEELGVAVFTHPEAPAAVPCCDDEQLFIYHAGREAAFYDQHATAICQQLNELTGNAVASTEFRSELTALTKRHVDLAVEALAKGKPIVEVEFGSTMAVTH